MCKHLLDPEYSHTVVDDPVFRLKQIITNMRLNEKKGKLLAEAKEAREAKAASTDSSGKDDLFVTPTKQVFVNSNSNHDLASETRQALGAMNIRGRKSSSSSDENVAGQSVFKPTQDLRVANAQVHSTSQPHSNDGHVSQLNSSVQGPMAPPLSTPSRNRQKGSGRAAKGTRGRQTPLVTPTKAQATSTSSSLKRCRSEVDGCQDGSPTKRKAR